MSILTWVTMMLFFVNPDREPTLDIRLSTLVDGFLSEKTFSRTDDPMAVAAAGVGLDLHEPPHPLVAWKLNDQKLFYVFYKTIDEAFGDRPYVIQRIKKTVKDYASPDDRKPKVVVTYQVEVFKTNGGLLKGLDQHFGRFSLQGAYKKEVIKEYEIGFGYVEGECIGKKWPFEMNSTYHLLYAYGPDARTYRNTKFNFRRKWRLEVGLDRDGNYFVRSPELDIDIPRQTPPIETSWPKPDEASRNIVLEEGVGLLGLRVGKSQAPDISKALGRPLEIVRPSKAARNYSYARSLTFNILDNGPINTDHDTAAFCRQDEERHRPRRFESEG